MFNLNILRKSQLISGPRSKGLNQNSVNELSTFHCWAFGTRTTWCIVILVGYLVIDNPFLCYTNSEYVHQSNSTIHVVIDSLEPSVE